MKPARIIKQLEKSGLRGRGGAGFPTATKWAACLKAKGKTSTLYATPTRATGAFMDRVLLESDPHAIIEGMAIAGHTIGAKQGYIYVREEYPLAIERLEIALKQAEGKAFLAGKFWIRVSASKLR